MCKSNFFGLVYSVYDDVLTIFFLSFKMIQIEVKMCSTCFDKGKVNQVLSKTNIEILRSLKLVHNKSKAGTSLVSGSQRMATLLWRTIKYIYYNYYHKMHLIQYPIRIILTILLYLDVSKDDQSVYQMVAKFLLFYQL